MSHSRNNISTAFAMANIRFFLKICSVLTPENWLVKKKTKKNFVSIISIQLSHRLISGSVPYPLFRFSHWKYFQYLNENIKWQKHYILSQIFMSAMHCKSFKLIFSSHFFICKHFGPVKQGQIESKTVNSCSFCHSLFNWKCPC